MAHTKAAITGSNRAAIDTEHISRITVLHHVRNLGIRQTFEHLYRASSREFIFLNSADGQWETRLLFDLIPFSSDWDIIIASRKSEHYSLGRRLVSWAFNMAPLLLFGVRTHDAGAVKLVKREVIDQFPLISKSPFSEAERLVRAVRGGYRVTHYPVQVAPRQSGNAHGVSLALLFDAVLDCGRLWWQLHWHGADIGTVSRSEFLISPDPASARKDRD